MTKEFDQEAEDRYMEEHVSKLTKMSAEELALHMKKTEDKYGSIFADLQEFSEFLLWKEETSQK